MSYNNQNNKKDSWRKRVMTNRQGVDINKRIKKQSTPSEDDVVLKHEKNGSNIRIKDDGSIGIFADSGLGISIRPDTGSIMFYGETMGMQASTLHFHTEEDGLKWNYTPFNRALAEPWTEIMTARRFGTQALMKALTNPGAYISSAPGTPAAPGTIQSLKAFDIQGEQAYSGWGEQIQKTKTLMKAVKHIKDSFDLPDMGGIV